MRDDILDIDVIVAPVFIDNTRKFREIGPHGRGSNGIELVDYSEKYGEGASQKLSVELMSGRGPDILTVKVMSSVSRFSSGSDGVDPEQPHEKI